MIEFLGLDKAAGAVYRALLAEGGGPADLSLITGLSEGDIRAALGTLVGLNLVRAPADTSDDWHPLRPELRLAALTRQAEADLLRMTHQLAVLQATATAAAAAATAAAAGSARLRHTAVPVEPLETGQEALAEAGRLAAHATTEYLQVMPSGLESVAALHGDLTLHKAAALRGVRVKALYHDSTRRDPAAFGHVRRAAQAGTEVRTGPMLPPPMVICDRKVLLIPAAEDQPETALCIREPSIVAVLGTTFDNSWDTATPLDTAPERDGPEILTAAEQTLLQLAGAGLTDDAAASRLGVSGRTVARRMENLMRALKATSRFQAGLNAARNGWL